MPAGSGTGASARRPLARGEFVWGARTSNGQTIVFVGPCVVSKGEEYTFYKPDPDRPGEFIYAEDPLEVVQRMVTLGPNDYVVMQSPVVADKRGPAEPNGKFTEGTNDNLPKLDEGKVLVITEGSFPIWPGQQFERRDVHILGGDQYLLAVVQGVVDDRAPYYDVTRSCAQVTKATIESTAADAPTSGDDGENKGADGESKTGDGEGTGAEGAKEKAPAPAPPPSEATVELIPGLRIIISGKITPRFIPPTGVEVVPANPGDPKSVVRKAMMLGPGEYCIRQTVDGTREVDRGPGRVVPGPNDEFVTPPTAQSGIFRAARLTANGHLKTQHHE